MSKLFKKVQVLDTCKCDIDEGWSFALALDGIKLSGWYDPEFSYMKLWYRDTQIIVRGESAKDLAKSLEVALQEYKAVGLNHFVFNYD